MALGWIQVDANLRTHRKAVHLAALVGDRRAWTYLVELWSWASQNEPTGLIRGPAAQMVVEQVAGWGGESGKLSGAMVAAGWIDVREEGLYLHDWHDHQGAHIAKAEADAERQRQNREKNKGRYGASSGHPSDVHATSQGQRSDGAENPSDVQGKKKKKSKKKEEAAEAAQPLFGLDETPAQEPERKASEQESFAEWFESERREVLGTEWSDDFRLKPAHLNGEFLWLKDVDQEVVTIAARIYLADPKRRSQSPPCQLRWFSADRAEYLDKARRQLRGAA